MRDSGLPLPDELRGMPSHRRALICDEDRTVREALARQLAALGRAFEVTAATSPFELGRLCAVLKPEVVVIDVRMPGLDAIHACRAIRSDASSAGTVVVATLAPGSPDAERRFTEAGATRCFARPLDVAAIATFIESTIEQPSRPTTRRRRTAR
jgi:CheY-like chemotaxis protein